MINVYAPTADDYSNNGLLVLDPWCVSAKIREKLNGEYTLTLELEINARTVEVVNEMVIKAPAPVRFTPQLDIYTPSATEIWKVNTNTRRLSLRTKPSTTTGRVLHAYKKGTEVIVTDKSNPNWYVVAAPDGRSGYMEVRWLQYVRDEYSAPVTTGVIEQHKTKEQLFRVRSVSSTLDTITVEAQHISYDLRRNYIKSAATKGKAGAEAFPVMMAATLSAHEFDAYSDMETEITENIKRTNPIAALFSDGGLVSMAGGEVLRDNFDIYWVQHIGQDRGVTVAYRKNMAGMDVKIDTNGLVTRIIPVGYSKNNEPIYGDPIDSPHIDEYAQPYIMEYEYKDVKVGSGYKTAAEVKTEIERRARLEYDNGIDLPTVSASVDYVDLQNTDIGVDFNAFTGVFLGDTIRIRHEDYRFDIATEINAYEWDVLLGEYVSLELGSKQASLSDVRISPSQIGNGTLAGRKLAAGTVSGAELGEGSVGENHITENAVTANKIADGSITADKLIAGSVTAEKIAARSITAEKISAEAVTAEKIAAGSITAEKISAEAVTAEKIAAGSITAEKISAEAVTADKIKAGAVNAAKIDAGAVTAEKIASKSITAEQISAGAITAQSGIIANGAIGTAQIADGSITEAKVVSLNADVIKTGTLSADRLLLAGENGVIYKINATSSGLSMTELSKDQYKNYINGTVIVAKSITAAQIAARTITGNEILAGSITAQEIDVSDLFAAEATIQALNAMDITGNKYLKLMVSDAVDGMRVGGTQLIRGSKQFSTGQTGAEGWSFWNCSTYTNSSGALPEHKRLQQNMTDSGEWQSSARTPLIALPDDWQGRQLTLSAYLSAAAWAAVDKGITWVLCLSNGSTQRGYICIKYNIVVPGSPQFGSDVQYDSQPEAGKLVRAWTTFTLDESLFAADASSPDYDFADCTHMFVQFWLRQNGDVRTAAPKLEWGNKVTDWAPAPEDTDAEIAEVRSELTLTADQISASVSELSTNVDSLGNRVTTAETSLKLKADQATLTSTAGNLQSQIDAIPGKITLAVDAVNIGGTQLIRDTQEFTAGSDADHWRFGGGASTYSDASGFGRIRLTGSGATEDVWIGASSPLTPLPSGWQGRQATLSAWIWSADWTAVDNGIAWTIALSQGGTTRLNYGSKYNIVKPGEVALGADAVGNRTLANGVWVRVSTTFTLDSTGISGGDGTLSANTHIFVQFYLRRNGDVRIYGPKLEFGNRATDWSQYPDEFRAGSSVTLTKDEVKISTPEFNVEIVGDDGETNMLSIDEDGAQMQSLTAPDVAPRYKGPATLYVNPSATAAQIAAGNYFRSLADALAALSNRWINKNIVINLAAGMTEYGTCTLGGTAGSGGITIQGDSSSPAKLVGRLNVYYSCCPVLARYLNIDSASGSIAIDCAGAQTMMIVENCVLTGADASVTSYGVRAFRGAHVDIHSSQIYDYSRALYASQTGSIQAYGCKGNCKVGVNCGHMYAAGTMPDSETTFTPAKWGGEVFTSSVTVDQGSKPTPETAPTTVTVGASATDSYYSASGAWINQDNIIRQGYYSGMGEWAGCMWFPTTSFSGKTIKSGSLTLTRTSGSGRSGDVTLTLYGITTASASGNPHTGKVSYGTLGAVGNGETKTFTLPAAAAQALANGTIKGFMLYANDGAVMSGRSYSTNYCKIGSSGDVLPKLSVSY